MASTRGIEDGMKKTAVALLLVAGPALAGAGVLQDSATAGQTHHTTHYVLKQTANHRIGKYDFAGTDRILSAGSHDVVGYDAVTFHLFPQAGPGRHPGGVRAQGRPDQPAGPHAEGRREVRRHDRARHRRVRRDLRHGARA